MNKRGFWIERIEEAWKRRSIIWLMGVRRAGKTVLCQSLEGVEYFDFELPSARRAAKDPEAFLESLKSKRVVFDEIHRLPNPSELLKISADYFPHLKVIATGSSTLSATKKFKDTLAGRKNQIWLTPMTHCDLKDFEGDIENRLKLGGLPPFYLHKNPNERDYLEWVEAYWAKDVQELFRLEKRDSFMRFFELLMAQSGGIFEATRFARACEVSRTAIMNYLRTLEETLAVQILRPFTTRKSTEIVSAPKVYGFDTGFSRTYRGWNELRPEDYGLLWEHYVLNEVQALLQNRRLQYWRDKRGHEVDIVIPRKGAGPIAIECKWSPDNFDASGLLAFRRQYPDNTSIVVCRQLTKPFTQKDPIPITFSPLEDLQNFLPVPLAF